MRLFHELESNLTYHKKKSRFFYNTHENPLVSYILWQEHI